ncbi:cytosolic Fe-S cluster assembly factor NAR1, putative [Plasmodium gallinaceum]|uniref:Cytosolic Fe-S cluster assembly factor NAR1, putative n=1 Tax=Plasmodium gallinaceum TaxID=5849 RepID=A0A1J1GN21_PLAGA|nr:cytosolic Fe-S cluster assembly factor NAR1, putative [Plasmodium gallinaceum]CRG93723.1 cytosolic Fe-S cluster assembly factor NAR1, putative [Plasmodium gallinaceum]
MFSNAIKLENLNDYYNDSEECIKPFLYNSDIVNENKLERPNLININKKNKKNKNDRGEISLTDCLACSGCVTNEETNFLKSQNSLEILNNLKKKKINIISLSLQSLTALSVYYNLPLSTTQNKLCFFLKSLNFNYVYDSSLSELIALNESKNEFINFFYRNNPELHKEIDSTLNDMFENDKNKKPINEFKYMQSKLKEKLKKNNDKFYEKQYLNKKYSNYDNKNAKEKQYYNSRNYSNNSNTIMNDNKYRIDHIKDEIKDSNLYPLICSHCSGSVIYGEKNFDEELLNSFSKIKSSQDIQGIIVKILHLQKGLYCVPLINNYFFDSFFKSYNYNLKFINIFRKHFLKDNNIFKTNIDNNNFINNDNNKLSKDPSLSIYDINHVYLLYCFDKKLEAHRNNIEQQKEIEKNIERYLSHFIPNINSSKNNENYMNINSKNKFYCVDAVLTTVELIELIKSMNIDFYTLPELSIDNIYSILKETNDKIKKKNINEINSESNIEKNNNENKNIFINVKLQKEKEEKKVNGNNFYKHKKTNENITDSKEKSIQETLEYEICNMEYFTEKNTELKFIYDQISNYSIRCSNKNNISMGYGEEIFKFVCKEVFNFNIDENNFNLKYDDIIVLSLFKNNKCVFRVVLSYGFKSMHKVIRKLKENKSKQEVYENQMNKDDTYQIKIIYNLNFSGRIDYVELMACEKGCLFGCAQNIFVENPQNFSSCSCHNFNIFKKINNEQIIENFDFLFSDNYSTKEENNFICSSEIHKESYFDKKKNNEKYDEKEKNKQETLFEKNDKEKLFKNLHETMHNNKFTLYINSDKCKNDYNVNFFLKNIFYIFNTNTFHLFKGTFSSKKKLDIINW